MQAEERLSSCSLAQAATADELQHMYNQHVQCQESIRASYYSISMPSSKTTGAREKPLIHITFTENSSSVSKMTTSESHPSTTTPDMNDTDDTSDALSADEVEDDNATTNAGLFKKEIHKAVYRFFKGEHNLFSVATLNRLSVSLTPRTLSGALDLFSYHLLSKGMTASKKNVLKNPGPSKLYAGTRPAIHVWHMLQKRVHGIVNIRCVYISATTLAFVQYQ
ncbi:hypothetical protein V8B55DRAFT_1334502 [Mucor lusitanicus]|uniref:Uncharacterized protein n=2 Tax=Mucor circinelloides f. lusitanicus TaxID=29924 RepID=A0A168Q9J4_MUCCL|nr:hypothetical protein FB192DRAFT_1340909 [Mucor lusitanicus]OAD08911.1 hypothetical protein MUCCIDRAFT_76218 [Mucor lusitanicus CBS 277.49]